MRYLSLDEVYALHQRMIHVGGGRIDIHDFTLLHSAVERPKANFGGKELYATMWKKASALLHSLVNNHPFDDGNKRTAYYSAKRFLRMNGYTLDAPLKEILRFMVSVDVKKLTVDQIGVWLKTHSKRTSL